MPADGGGRNTQNFTPSPTNACKPLCKGSTNQQRLRLWTRVVFTLRSRELGAGKLGPSIGNASPQMQPRGCNRARKARTAGSASPWSTCAITDMVRICFGFGLSTTVGSCVDVKFTCSKRCAWVKPGHPITACACGTPAQRPRRNRFAPAPPPRPHTPSCHACRESRVCRGGVLVSGLHNFTYSK